MPGFDGTGPTGQGPMTGRGRGYCIVPLNNIKKGYSDPKKIPSKAFWPGFSYINRINTRYRDVNPKKSIKV